MSQTMNSPGALASVATRPVADHNAPQCGGEDEASFDAMVSAAWRAGLEAGEHLAATRQRTAALVTLESLTVDQLAECMTALSALLDTRTARQAPRRGALRIVRPGETAVTS